MEKLIWEYKNGSFIATPFGMFTIGVKHDPAKGLFVITFYCRTSCFLVCIHIPPAAAAAAATAASGPAAAAAAATAAIATATAQTVLVVFNTAATDCACLHCL